MAQILEGIRILDLTRWLAGPVSSMYLGDMGAEVIKIETPKRGDDSRHVGPNINGESGYFLSLNRNKKSLTLNLKSDKGVEIFKELVKKADVVMENFAPGTMNKLGLGYDVLKSLNPKIIYASCSGFGQEGPYAKKPSYDAIMQAHGGIMSITGTKESGPTRVGVSVADFTAGLNMTIGILAALFNRERNGVGQFLDISLLDCQISLLENPVMRYFATGQNPGPVGNRHPSITPYGAFPTKNGYMMIAAANDRQWQILCKAMEREDLLEDERFTTNQLRTKNYEALKPMMDETLKHKTTQEWVKILEERQIPCGPINTIEDVAHDPQVEYRNMILTMKHPVAGEVKVANNPLKFSETPTKLNSPPPVLGEHSSEVLSRVLGYSEDRIEALKDEEVI